MSTEEMIEKYNDLRQFCADLAYKNKGALMGDDAWLCYAVQSRDITLAYHYDGINCSGLAYTTQTMCNEWFDFTIPLDLIPADLL